MPVQLFLYCLLAPSLHVTSGVVVGVWRNDETAVRRTLETDYVVEHHREKRLPMQFETIPFHVDEVGLGWVDEPIPMAGGRHQRQKKGK